MKHFHHISMRVFCKEEKDEIKIIQAARSLYPYNLEEQKLKLDCTIAEGFDHKKIKIYTLALDKDRHINAFFDSFRSKLTKEQKYLLVSEIESRLDSSLAFYIRLNKERLIEGDYEITDTGNCFHLTFLVAAYPHKREIAVNMLKNLFLENQD
jgi:RNA binding exosome subunit